MLARTVIPGFRCPSEENDDFWADSMNGVSQRAIGSYVGNAGSDLGDDPYLPSRPFDNVSTSHVDVRTSNGVLLAMNMVSSTRRTNPVRFGAISDGLSNTVLCGESPSFVEEPCRVCDRIYLYSNNQDSNEGSDFSETLCSTYYPINLSYSKKTHSEINASAREMSFGSYHPGGCNVAICDGSVRFVSETMDLQVWRAVGSRNEGESLDQW